MASLSGNTIASTFTGLLKTNDNGARAADGATPDQCSDGAGNTIPLFVSATEVYAVGSGTGTSHTAFGKDCGVDLAAGTGNSLFGEGAGADVTTGEHNTAVGYRALYQGTTETNDNVAVGFNAMSGAWTTASVIDCVVIGSGAGAGALVGGASGLTAVGKAAGAAVTSGAKNTALGFGAGTALTTSDNNVAIGYNALYQGTTESDDNVAIGYNAMSGAIGTEQVNDCVAIGSGALAGALDSTDGADEASGTVAIGKSAGAALTEGAGNTFVGYNSGTAITIGNYNTSFGNGALLGSVDGDFNTAIGYQALEDYEGADGSGKNTAVGYQAGKTISTGASIVAIGSGAMSSGVTTANEIVAIGEGAAAALTSGGQNIAIGRAAMDEHTTGSNNIAIGVNAMTATQAAGTQTTSAGSGNNIFIGRNSGGGDWANDATSENIGIGNYAMDAALNNSIRNVAIGHQALSAQTSGRNNTCVGYQAGDVIQTGSRNTLIGTGTSMDAENKVDVVCLGYGMSGDSNTINLGSSNTSKIYVANDSTSWANASDERIKKDIEDCDLGLAFVNDLRPVTFKWRAYEDWDEELKEEGMTKTGINTEKLNYGFVAQEVKTTMDSHNHSKFPAWGCSNSKTGEQSLSKGNFMTPVIKAIQELSAKVTALENA